MPFSPKARALLKSLSHQPWGLYTFKSRNDTGIRVMMPYNAIVCPVCMAANIKLGEWRFTSEAYTANRKAWLGLEFTDVVLIIKAADSERDPHRKELIKLLGGIRTKENYNPVTQEYKPDATR